MKVQLGGEGGIRTHETLEGPNSFQDCPFQPLTHLSEWGQNRLFVAYSQPNMGKWIYGRVLYSCYSIAMVFIFLGTILLLASLAMLFALNALFNTLRFGLPFVKTPRWAVTWMLQHLQLKPNDVWYELGCGDAYVLAALARKFPQTKFVGWEIQWWPYVLARWRVRNLANVTIHLGNFLLADISSATVVYGFFITSLMAQIATKLSEELRPGAQVISFGFDLPSWHQTQDISDPAGAHKSKLRFYKK